jgi:hypothetical protein
VFGLAKTLRGTRAQPPRWKRCLELVDPPASQARAKHMVDAIVRAMHDDLTPRAARAQVHGDGHSPGRLRVDGDVSNMPEFADAFACKAGAPMALSALVTGFRQACTSCAGKCLNFAHANYIIKTKYYACDCAGVSLRKSGQTKKVQVLV